MNHREYDKISMRAFYPWRKFHVWSVSFFVAKINFMILRNFFTKLEKNETKIKGMYPNLCTWEISALLIFITSFKCFKGIKQRNNNKSHNTTNDISNSFGEFWVNRKLLNSLSFLR